jgi:ferredoxin-NADP reductase
MAKYKSKLLERKEIAEGTMEFHFSKPEGFNYKPGQHIEITLINPPETDEEGNSRVLSLVSAPYEPNLIVATRMRDTAFKRVLKTMPLESEVYIEGPYVY